MLVLIIEDNRHLAANMVEFLETEGLECDWAERGDHGLELACDQSFDVIILDLMLPRMDGIEVCRELKSRGVTTPVLMLTARDTLDDKLEGFDAGADDYLVKPFDLPELLARLKVLAKRCQPRELKLQVGDLVADLDTHRVTRDGQDIQLSRLGWQLLITLMQASPRVMSRQELEQIVWKGEPPDSDALKAHLYSLRKQIDKPFDRQLLHTLRGVGVVIRDEEQRP